MNLHLIHSVRNLRMLDRRHALAVALLCSASLLGACTTVSPWERGTLAKPHMALTPNPGQSALRSHLEISREAASGGGTAAGGGCGCN